MQLYRYFVSQSSEFYRHNPLYCFWKIVYCCKRVFRYRLSPETFGYILLRHVNVKTGWTGGDEMLASCLPSGSFGNSGSRDACSLQSSRSGHLWNRSADRDAGSYLCIIAHSLGKAYKWWHNRDVMFDRPSTYFVFLTTEWNSIKLCIEFLNQILSGRI
jgi:hypothetical protein